MLIHDDMDKTRLPLSDLASTHILFRAFRGNVGSAVVVVIGQIPVDRRGIAGHFRRGDNGVHL